MSDFLRDQTSGELTGWLAYLRIDDEVQTQRTTLAILKAFNSGKQPAKHIVDDDEDGPPIDTTDPKFVEQFQGFSQPKPQPPRGFSRQRSTEILLG